MTLLDCLQSLQGYGVALLNNGGGLVIQSDRLILSDGQRATLAANKPLLLAIMPADRACPVGTVLDALEAYEERIAIMHESPDVLSVVAEQVAQAQARRVLSPDY